MTMKFKALLVACVILGLLTEPLGAQNSATERVIGGHSPTLAWPYAASIIIDGSLLCGGTLVAPKFVLTAAHCTTDERTLQVRKSFEIRLGSSSRESGGEVFHAIRVITHENFGKPHRLENDIALLELDRSADIQPVQLEGLPASSGRSVSIDNESRAIPFAKIVGWGRTNPIRLFLALRRPSLRPIFRLSTTQLASARGPAIRASVQLISGEFARVKAKAVWTVAPATLVAPCSPRVPTVSGRK